MSTNHARFAINPTRVRRMADRRVQAIAPQVGFVSLDECQRIADADGLSRNLTIAKAAEYLCRQGKDPARALYYLFKQHGVRLWKVGNTHTVRSAEVVFLQRNGCSLLEHATK